MTEFEKRKKDMKELWKETFHDSDRYIDLVFNTYFSLENSFVRYHENRIIAALLCVPYKFQILTKEGNKRILKGMYLCGLATHPEWRKRGIMADLMKEAEASIFERGYDMTFLIPADDHLREYYRRKGYINASWRTSQIYYRGEGLMPNVENILHTYPIKEFFKEGKNEFLHGLAEWCRNKELLRRDNTIIHSQQDLLAIMAENENSIFLSKGPIDPDFPILAKVVAVVFPELPETPENPPRIVGLYYQDKHSIERHCERNRPEKRIDEFVNDVELNKEYERRENKCKESNKNTEGVRSISPEIVDSILKAFDLQSIEFILPINSKHSNVSRRVPYAMIKDIQDHEKQIENHILEFEISLMLD